MSTLLNSAMTHNSIVMKTKLGHSLKTMIAMASPSFPSHTRTHTHTHTLIAFSSSKENCFFSNVFVPKKSKCDLSAYKYTILHFIQHTRVCTCRCICVRVRAYLFLKLYLYKYHLSVHVHIYLTNSIYLQIGVAYSTFYR